MQSKMRMVQTHPADKPARPATDRSINDSYRNVEPPHHYVIETKQAPRFDFDFQRLFNFQLRTASLFGGALLLLLLAAAAAAVGTVVNAAAPPISSGASYKVISRNSSKLLSIVANSRDNDARVNQFSDVGAPSQAWRFEQQNDGYYKITNVNSGKVLDARYNGTANGTFLIQYDSNNADNQRFRVEDVGGGYVRIVGKASGRVVDVEGVSQADGAFVHLWDWVSGANQQWQLVQLNGNPPPPQSMVYEAEAANHTAQPNFEATWPGYTGNGYLGNWGGNGQTVTFRVNVTTSGSYTLAFRYSSGYGNQARRLTVNNSASNKLNLPGTSSFNEWRVANAGANLQAGDNTVQLAYDSGYGSTSYVNLDSLTITTGGGNPPDPPTPPTGNGQLTTRNGHLYRDGQPIQLRGVNYSNNSEQGVGNRMDGTGIDLMRLGIENVVSVNPSQLQRTVDDNRAHGRITLIDPHIWDVGGDWTGVDPTEFGDAFFQKLRAIANQFKGQPDVMLETWNEPFHRGDANEASGNQIWVDFERQAIQTIRDTGFTSVIVINSPNWGADNVSLVQRGPDVQAGFSNIMFDIHYYENGSAPQNSTQDIINQIQEMQGRGLAVLVGEVGVVNNATNLDPTPVLNAVRATGASVAAWQWGNPDENVLTTDGTANTPTAWGRQFLAFTREQHGDPTAPR